MSIVPGLQTPKQSGEMKTPFGIERKWASVAFVRRSQEGPLTRKKGERLASLALTLAVSPWLFLPSVCCLLSLVVHVAAGHWRGSFFLVFRCFGDHGFGRAEETRDRCRVLECRARNLRGIDDSALDEVNVLVGGGVETEIRVLFRANFFDNN